MTVVGHARIAERAEQDRVELVAQHRVAVRRHASRRSAGSGRRSRAASRGRAAGPTTSADGVQHLHGLGRDFLADAVAGNDCDAHNRQSYRRLIPWISQSSSVVLRGEAHWTKSFHRHRHPEAAADAQRRQAAAGAAARHLVEQRHEDPRAGAPIGWPSAIAPPLTFSRARIDRQSRSTASTCGANASFSSTRSKSSIGQPGPREELPHRRHRADAHDARIDAGRRPADDARERRQAAARGFVRAASARPRRRRR